ncbi:MAG: hypothetical protein EBT32_11780 [Betaproteobacteria bacterium]|nr:hypothetical protein [Betaproteobacteria bacterium]
MGQGLNAPIVSACITTCRTDPSANGVGNGSGFRNGAEFRNGFGFVNSTDLVNGTGKGPNHRTADHTVSDSAAGRLAFALY